MATTVEKVTIPLTVIEPRPCLPEGRIELVAELTSGAANHWALRAKTRQALVVLLLACAVAGFRHPVALAGTVVFAIPVVRGFARKEIVEDVLGPYMAAAVGTFGVAGAEMLCRDLPAPRRRQPPIEWLLACWDERLAVRSHESECGFGGHRFGCAHCPVRGDEVFRVCWPAPFNRWLAATQAAGLVV